MLRDTLSAAVEWFSTLLIAPYRSMCKGFALRAYLDKTAFTLSGLTAGYYFLHRPNLNTEIGWETGESVLDERLAFDLVSQRCSKCHSLERVLKANKDKQGGIKTVVRMAGTDSPAHCRQ